MLMFGFGTLYFYCFYLYLLFLCIFFIAFIHLIFIYLLYMTSSFCSIYLFAFMQACLSMAFILTYIDTLLFAFLWLWTHFLKIFLNFVLPWHCCLSFRLSFVVIQFLSILLSSFWKALCKHIKHCFKRLLLLFLNFWTYQSGSATVPVWPLLKWAICS